MKDYYARKLSAEKLSLCYEIAPPRVKQYLEAEIIFSLKFIQKDDLVLELGCGYGRILQRFSENCAQAFGIDSSYESLRWGKENGFDLKSVTNNASKLCFKDHAFNRVFCIQNGLSAFNVDPRVLVRECLRMIKPGGTAIFSSYSDRFWEDRLEWFRIQSRFDLIGEIDELKTQNGIIICKDGFTARTIRPEDFLSISQELGIKAQIEEVDNSSIFYIVTK